MHREGPRQYEAWGASQCRQGVIFVEKQSLQLTVCPARSPRCSAVTNPAPFPPVLRPDSPLRPLVRGTLQSVVERSLRGCEPAPASGPDPRAANHRASGRRATREKGGPRFAVAIASRSGRQPSAAGRPPRNQLFAEPQGVGTVQFTHVCLEVAASSLTNKQTDGTFLAGKDSRDKNGLSSPEPHRARGAHALQFSLRKPGFPTVLCCRSPGAPCCGPLLANVLPACQGKLAFALRRRLTGKWVRRRWLVHTQGEEDTGLFGGPPRGTWWLPRGCPGADRH